MGKSRRECVARPHDDYCDNDVRRGSIRGQRARDFGIDAMVRRPSRVGSSRMSDRSHCVVFYPPIRRGPNRFHGCFGNVPRGNGCCALRRCRERKTQDGASVKHRLDRGGCSDVRVGVGFVGAALGRTCWRRDMVAPVAAAVIRDSVYGFAIWSGGAEICFIPARQGGRLNT